MLGVKSVYKDISIQEVLRDMHANPKNYLPWVLNRRVYVLRGQALIFIGMINEKYSKQFEECPEPIINDWYITGFQPGNFTYGMNLELIMRNVNDVKQKIIVPTDDVPF